MTTATNAPALREAAQALLDGFKGDCATSDLRLFSNLRRSLTAAPVAEPVAPADQTIRSLGEGEFSDLVQLPQWSRIVEFARAARPVAPAAGELPPLPEPYATLHHDDGYFTMTERHEGRVRPWRTPAFTTEQMHAYARAALSAQQVQPTAEPEALHACWYCGGSPDDACQKPFDDVPCRRASPAAPVWRPIESAPRQFHPPLSTNNHHAPDILGVWGQSFYCVCSWGGPSQPFWIGGDNRRIPFQPTHWQPLPAPPKGPQS